MTVGINQTGEDELPGGVDDISALGNGHRAAFAHGTNAVTLDEYDRAGNGRAPSAVNQRRAFDCNRLWPLVATG